MSTPQNHIIKTQHLLLDLKEERGTREVENAFRRLNQDQLMNRLSAVCDEIGGDIYIERVTVDVGTIRQGQIAHDWVDQVVEKFKTQLQEAISEGSTNGVEHSSERSSVSAGHSKLDLLIHFLEKGWLPWWSSKFQPLSIERLLEESIEDEPGEVQRILSKCRVKEKVIRRLSTHFSNATCFRLWEMLTANRKESPAFREVSYWFGCLVDAIQKQLHWSLGRTEVATRRIVFQSIFEEKLVSVSFIADWMGRLERIISPSEYKEVLIQLINGNGNKRSDSRTHVSALQTLLREREEIRPLDPNTSGAEVEQPHKEPSEELLEKASSQRKQKLEVESSNQTTTEETSDRADRFAQDPKSQTADGPEKKRSKKTSTTPKRNEGELDSSAGVSTDDREAKGTKSTTKKASGKEESIDLTANQQKQIADSGEPSQNREFPMQMDKLGSNTSTGIDESAEGARERIRVIDAEEVDRVINIASNQSSGFERAPSSSEEEFGMAQAIKQPYQEHRDMRMDPDGQEQVETYIGNAGLVLLSPFLTRFFDQNGLLHEGSFKGEEQQHKAAYLLQLLVEEAPDLKEQFLVLNKLICGIPVDYPIDVHHHTDQEESSANELLRAVINHWQVLRNTSVEGFRQTFLRRHARVCQQDSAWLLQVEKSSFDVLLEHIPWQYSVIKLGWMAKPIFVEW